MSINQSTKIIEFETIFQPFEGYLFFYWFKLIVVNVLHQVEQNVSYILDDYYRFSNNKSVKGRHENSIARSKRGGY